MSCVLFRELLFSSRYSVLSLWKYWEVWEKRKKKIYILNRRFRLKWKRNRATNRGNYVSFGRCYQVSTRWKSFPALPTAGSKCAVYIPLRTGKNVVLCSYMTEKRMILGPTVLVGTWIWALHLLCNQKAGRIFGVIWVLFLEMKGPELSKNVTNFGANENNSEIFEKTVILSIFQTVIRFIDG